jgi:hypothetical protein
MVPHCDDDELSVIALGEPARPEDEEHLNGCAHCRSRLDQLTAVVASARSITADDRPVPPPPATWTAIADELGVDAGGTVTVLADRPRRSRPTWLVAAAAAAVGVVAGAVVTAGLTGGAGSADLVASAALDPIADSGFVGTAAVEQTADGAVLRIAVPDLPPVEDGYYEVWMASPDTTTMVAIGTLNPGQEGTFTLPAGMAVTDFPVVDVSVEHFDGDAGHSTVSVVRGQLQA